MSELRALMHAPSNHPATGGAVLLASGGLATEIRAAQATNSVKHFMVKSTAFSELVEVKVSRPAEGFATGRDFASTGSGAIPMAPQLHCLTADQVICGCVLPRRPGKSENLER
jgi:hypothetical protein